MCMFCVCEEKTHPPRLIWLNLEGHIYLRLLVKKIGNSCFRGLFCFSKEKYLF